MLSARAVTDIEEGRALWRRLIPEEVITDIWDVRECFHRHYQRDIHFLVTEDNGVVRGFLPLARIDEYSCYGYFPGETWSGKTWLEQNRVIIDGDTMLDEILAMCPGPYHVRYLLAADAAPQSSDCVDEIGYLFHPPDYDYELDEYFREFSHKTLKRLRRELDGFHASGASYRYDDLADFDILVSMNLDRFGGRSYFADSRFREGFRSLMLFLHERGWLRMTTVLMNGDPAAVDMGSVFNGTYTLLAGGTNASYPGVAKLINIHHMRRACEWKLGSVDFLCGDFAWKPQFHLSPRPLYLISNLPPGFLQSGKVEIRSAQNAP
jgi:hypothetical protein